MTLRTVSARGALALLVAGLALPAEADAQLLKRIRQRAEGAAERAAGTAIDRAADRATGAATDRAADAAGNAAANAAGSAANDAGLPAVAGGRGGSGNTVDFRTLQELLPAAFAGYTRGTPEGARNRMMGIEVSKAEARYERGDLGATLTITDTGTLRSWASLGAVWATMDVDNETADGFERTVDYRGHRALVKETRSGSRVSSEMSVIVSERFIVTADVDAGDARVAQAALDAVDLARLEALAGPKVEPISNERMLALLPATAGGQGRSGASASSGGVLGFSASTATAAYGPVTVTITDGLGLTGLASLAWLGGTYSNVTDAGFDRAARYKNLPGREKEMREEAGVSSELSVVVADRFWVQAAGNVPLAQVRAVLDAVNLDAIAALAPAPSGGQ